MAKKRSYRTERVAEEIQRELANILQFELKDPRIGMITIVGVEVSRDLSHAKVFYSLLDVRELPDTKQALESSKKFMRRHLAKQMKNMRIVPELHFFYDDSLERGNYLSSLIDSAIAEDKLNKNNNEENA
jgi:ribosome-binding factor A